ncbi:MAG: cytochrome c biogenesis protein CcdA [Oscillospiraceae bacterium]
MNFDLSVSVPVATVFLQGLISFFSPCVLPLLPLYLGYLSGGAASEGRRGRLIFNTFFFVLGVSGAFFILGLGMSAAGSFFSGYRSLFIKIGGIIVLIFGLYQLGIIKISALEREHRLPFDPGKIASGPIAALILGFTFSFAWTPCVGPALASVLMLAASASDSARGFLLIGVYTLGFVIPFMAVGAFADTLLKVFKRHRNVVKYTAKIGGVLLVLIGIMMITGFMNNLSDNLAGETETPAVTASAQPTDAAQPDSNAEPSESAEASDRPIVPAPDFTLTDQFGNEHTLSDYKGKVIFLNFWATWCSPCRMELPDIQELYEDYGQNSEDLIVLGVAAPNLGNEGTAEDIAEFLETNGYTYPVLMDTDGNVMSQYGISAFPTTFMIDTDGNVYGYVSGTLTREIMDDIISQTIANTDGESS